MRTHTERSNHNYKSFLRELALKAIDMSTIPAVMRNTIILPTLGGFILTIIVVVLSIALHDVTILSLGLLSLFLLFRGPYIVYRWNSGKICVRAFICTGVRKKTNGTIVAKCALVPSDNNERSYAFSNINIVFSNRLARGIYPNAAILVYSDVSSQNTAIAWEFAEDVLKNTDE